MVSEYLSHPCGVPGSTQTARGCIPLSGVFVPDLVLSCGHRRFSGCAAVGEPDCSGADLPQNLPIPDQRGVAEREGSYWGRKCCTLRPRAGPAETRHPDVFLCQRVLTVSAAAQNQGPAQPPNHGGSRSHPCGLAPSQQRVFTQFSEFTLHTVHTSVQSFYILPLVQYMNLFYTSYKQLPFLLS